MAVLVWLAVLSAAAYRLRFGVDFTDEAFYAAVPLRFVAGDRPFVDELYFTQTSALLTFPVVKAFVAASGGTDGLILLLRSLFLLAMAGVAGAVAFGARALVRPAIGSLAGLVAVGFVPYGIPTLSYNTCGYGFLTVALWLLFGADDAALGWRRSLVVGFAMASAVLSYPTLVVVGGAALLAHVWRARATAARDLARIGAGGILAGIWLAPFWGGFDLADVLRSYHFTAATGTYGVDPGEKMARVLGAFVAAAPGAASLAWLAGGLLYLVGARLRLLGIVVLSLAPLAALVESWGSPLGSNFCVAYVGASSVPLALLGWRDRQIRRVMAVVIVPSLLGGLMTAWTSDNGFPAMALGFLPAAVAAAIVASRLADLALPPPSGLGGGLVAMVAPVALVALLQLHSRREVYRDDAIASLDVEVARGPYRGLFTTAARRDFLYDVDAAVRAYVPVGGRAMFYNSFPAGHLILPMRGCTASVLVYHFPGMRPYYASSLSERLAACDAAFMMRSVPRVGRKRQRTATVDDDPLEVVIAGGMREVAVYDAFGVFARR
jgi:hypothetical protein